MRRISEPNLRVRSLNEHKAEQLNKFTMAEYENGFDADLRERNVCRFCLAQDVPLTNIYSSKNNAMQVSLSMQIMACSSIEVRVHRG